MAKNEDKFLPVWVKYYSRHFDDLYVLDHGSTDNSLSQAARHGKFIVQGIDYPIFNDFKWYTKTITDARNDLLKSYDVVMFCEPDEMLWHPKGLREYSRDLPAGRVQANGYEPCQLPKESALDWDKSLLDQRSGWVKNARYFDKTLLGSEPISWSYGFHGCVESKHKDPELLLVHLHYIDRQYALDRGQEKKKWAWSEEALKKNLGTHIMSYDIMLYLMNSMVSTATAMAPNLKAAKPF